MKGSRHTTQTTIIRPTCKHSLPKAPSRGKGRGSHPNYQLNTSAKTHSSLELEPQNLARGLAGVLHEAAVGGGGPERLDDTAEARGNGVLDVELSQEGLQGASGLLSMVVGNLGEQMVGHVGVADVVEDVVQEAVVAVDSAERALEPGPLVTAVMRNGRVRVLQVGDQHKPHVDNQIRHAVRLCDPQEAHGGPEVDERSRHGDESSIADDNSPVLVCREEGRRGLEVAGARRVLAARGVGEEVGRPAEEQHLGDVEDADGTREGGDFAHLTARGRNEDLVALNVVGGAVVLRVADAPRVVGHQEAAVQHESNNVAQGNVV
eukprot:m.531132 g.531132  ORF g.531132 m.531132 type:complete len:320 (+) comp57576_c0_seq3:110-1069(+)